MVFVNLQYMQLVIILLTFDATSVRYESQLTRSLKLQREKTVDKINDREHQQLQNKQANMALYINLQRQNKYYSPQIKKKRMEFDNSPQFTPSFNKYSRSDDMWSIESEYNSDLKAKTDSMMGTDLDHSNSRYDMFKCCDEVFGSCRMSCESLPLITLATSDSKIEVTIRLELKKYCPPMQAEFWSCINRTLCAVKRGSHWSGRNCCVLGLSAHCRNVCITSSSSREVINACRKSDEQRMYSCFEKQEFGDKCCENARTSECLQACRDFFDPRNQVTQTNLLHLKDMCHEKNSDILRCVSNSNKVSTMKNSQIYLPCCNLSNDDTCKRFCRNILNTTDSIDVIRELQFGGCGTPMPHLSMWQCFFFTEHMSFPNKVQINSSASKINQIGFDAAKLYCCGKAFTLECKRLCMQTYYMDWTANSRQFQSNCLIKASELELQQCIDEVDEPCELGCDGLHFCTNFNNRPTELFRKCNSEADTAAIADFQMWLKEGHVNLPGFSLPIKNISICMPEKWKAIACTLQIKPCTLSRHFNHICREDCYDILNECIDWSRINSSINADSVCSGLHPINEDMPCLSLRLYMEESGVPKNMAGHRGLTSPCARHPCNASEVCLPRQSDIAPFDCIPGCILGETANYIVPIGAYVRISVGLLDNTFQVCRCVANGRIDSCQPLPSYSYNNCYLPGGRSIKHGSSFYLECNLCSCFAEEITCTKRQCHMPGYSDASYTSLPCNCPLHYVPVCAQNGNTYHSACIAKCLGLRDNEFEYGPCSSFIPCKMGSYHCPIGMKCLEQRKICLSSMDRPCLQYKCVNYTTACQISGTSICDSNGESHSSACHLIHSKAKFSYWGKCLRNCSLDGQVCGINGATYLNECIALADHVLVDYRGRCREVGLLNIDIGQRCRSVKCAKYHRNYCHYHVPPGACCPICGGAFHVIYSRKQIDRAFYAIRSREKNLLTLQNILKELNSLVQIADCQLTGFLTLEVGIFIAIVPRTKNPTRIQVEGCTREADKISTQIELQSHRITTNLILSSLTVSNKLQPILGNCATKQYKVISAVILLSISLVIF